MSLVNVAGNDQPTWMTDATTGAIVLNEPLKYGVTAGAVVTHYKKCARRRQLRRRLQPGHHR